MIIAGAMYLSVFLIEINVSDCSNSLKLFVSVLHFVLTSYPQNNLFIILLLFYIFCLLVMFYFFIENVKGIFIESTKIKHSCPLTDNRLDYIY